MASIRVTHTIADLESDCRKIVAEAPRRMTKVVAKNVRQGHVTAQRIARQKSGPHGANYWKRITAEMTGPLSGEWGPTGEVVGNAVGAGYRHGANTDMEKSQDIQGPRFAKDAASIFDSLFWPS